MFKAILVACIASGAPGECITFTDQMGPYRSIDKCEQRALAMSRDVHRYMKGWKGVSYECNPLPKGQL